MIKHNLNVSRKAILQYIFFFEEYYNTCRTCKTTISFKAVAAVPNSHSIAFHGMLCVSSIILISTTFYVVLYY